ncbi:adhesion G-protein coupled receptor V1 isoform X5 [Corvus moneduloides]|uniref:adhesion G-protein coupled receptor V1 isoform X5 n=1 Tax=Corvus moneduloides TaxID=1196302 RepID=UPI00136409D0|nr:adhesion G-protein coupled receptor V1 isoform X5 [Corvus moneduloides]
MFIPQGPGMPSASLLVYLLLALFIHFTSGETEVKFSGQTEFVVNETSTTVIRLVIERTGKPANITAVVSIYGENTGDFFDTYAAAFIPDTETNRTVYISVCDDDLPEADETFTFHLTLLKPSARIKLGSPKSVTVTILSNDNAFGIISFNMSALITVNEPRGRNEFVPLTLIRERGTYGTVIVTFEIEDGPNSAEEDLSPARGNITFTPGRSVLIYNLTVLDDQVPENDEIFVVCLKSVEGGAEINNTKNSVWINIKKNDSPVRFVQNAYMVPEEDEVVTIQVVRGKDVSGKLIGPDEDEVSVNYAIITGDSTAHAQLNVDFLDLQPNTTLVFPPLVHETYLKFKILDDAIPEIAETFQIMLLKETLQGDAVLIYPSVVHVTIQPNDKPYGVLSIHSVLLAHTVIIDEDKISRFEGITVVRNGGTHGNVSVSWVIIRNNSDPSPVTADLLPESGEISFDQGQMLETLHLNVIDDDIPEEAEPYLLKLLAHTIQGGAEVSEPSELLFYIQDSDDVYGLIKFHPLENQKIESNPMGRFLSLSFARERGTVGDVQLFYTSLYIPAGALDPERAKGGILNMSRRSTFIFPEGKAQATINIPIRNDAFLQNGAHFVIQLEKVELLNRIPLVPPVSPRLGEIRNISLRITPDIANGEIGFTSNLPIILSEPEELPATVVSIALHRDGTDGQATVFWSLKPSGPNHKAITQDDISPFNGSVVFLSGQSDTTINITIKADDIPEMNETVLLTLDRVSVENQILKYGFTTCEITILENDDPGGVFEFSPSSRGPYSIKEGDSVELQIVRSRGTLLRQFLRYTVEPRNDNEFYGSTGILEFKPGEREIIITLLTRMDGIPELDEAYAVVLSGYSEMSGKLGNATRVNIMILKNDDPHGVIQFLLDELSVTIKESKGEIIYAASYRVVRNQGNYGNVSVSWIVDPACTNDIYPEQGTIFFDNLEFSKNITIYSLPDEVPEEMEVFIIRLFNATGGARLGNITSAFLQITRNDDPIYFAEPLTVSITEGSVANFTVLRSGSADAVVAVQYITVNGDATAEEGDFVPSGKNSVILFGVGEREQNLSVYINDDDTPETDETFYIFLLNSTGDTVIFNAGVATVIIEANDDPNGIFSLESLEKAVEEGKSNSFLILRHRGHFGNVSLTWQLFHNGSTLKPGEEFYETCGTVYFMDGEGSKPIVLHALSDKIPEFNEFYSLKLVNVSGGSPGPGGQLSETSLAVTVMIPSNDDPFGVFVLDPESQDREIVEDILSEDDLSCITDFTIWRKQGTFGVVRLGWEILSSTFQAGLPSMVDYLLLGSFPSSVQSQPHMRRHHSGTDALYFSGKEDAFGIIGLEYPYNGNTAVNNFTFSAWLIPNVNTDGYIVEKDDGNGTLYYGVKIQTNDSHVSVVLHYTALGSNMTYIAKAAILKYLDESTWIHVLITLDESIIEFYMDGISVPGGIKSLKGEAIADGPGIVRIGAGINGNSRYMGLMQDVRLYERKLTQAEIYELHAAPAKSDVHPVSGYLEYRQGETNKSFIVSAKDDKEEEGEELFILKLISVCGGARISQENTTARLRIQKSDNANGLFGFTGACIPETADEGSTISCVVERTRGALDYVYINYIISQVDSSGINYSISDFSNSSGTITFLPWQRSKVLNLHVIDDDIPELNEYFRVTLVSAVSGDGKLGSTPTSGASIDPEKETTDISIKASDHPYGLLQFSVGPPPQPSDEMILPASSVPHITVKEEVGHIRLLVVRAQGLLGTVIMEYRTVPLTAFSPKDYQAVGGSMEFQPGERYKYITVNITDNSIPELEKTFKVELLNPEGGVAELFRNDGSGSGDGNMDLFLSSVPQHASLGIASHILVTIEASDDAHGVFEFSAESLLVNGTEPEDGDSNVVLQVVRTHGALSQVTLYWIIICDFTNDLISTDGSVTFDVGQARTNITIQVSPDDVPELDKIFSVLIINVSHGRLGFHTNATLTILANDDPYGVFIFSEQNRPIKVDEETKNVSLTVIRCGGLLGTVMVKYRTIGDEEKSPFLPHDVVRAIEGKDYIPITGYVIFSTNESEATISLPILDDDDPERSESVFVELSSIALIKKVQDRPIINSPRLGLVGETIAHVIINANDDAFGTLQLSASAVRVAENYVGPIINVTRTGGIFSDVSVKFKAMPITATAGEDYSVASSDVVLLEGETSKAVPIYIINDINPEVEESFYVQLLNQTTGGALLGSLTRAIITIEASDDPFGSFVFQNTEFTVEEPEFGSVTINLPIIRNAGTLGNVTVQWAATINGRPAADDLQVAMGNITFAAGEAIQMLLLEILADDVPEVEEIVHVELTQASNGGAIGLDSTANIVIPANDNPYGTVFFHQSSYRIQEPLERNLLANISVRRSGGRFGQLQIFYSTSEIDIVALAIEQGEDILAYYESPVQGIPDQPSKTRVNVSAASDPLHACATQCLKEKACSAFIFSSASEIPLCLWLTTEISLLTNMSGLWTYKKNISSTSTLFSTQAIAGSDYESITRQWAIMQEGEEFANLTVTILPDSLPELDEKFAISLLKVELMNISANLKNQPTIGQPNTSTVIIMMNGDAFGVFKIYSLSPNATEKGLYIEVEERPQASVQLMIHRTEGSLGQVAVEWCVVGGTATPDLDFVGVGEILVFAEGETKKMVTLTILDDPEPEDNESIIISLVHTEGGSRILPSFDTVTVVILASDNVAGIISFQTDGRSVIGCEGEQLQFHIVRTAPGLGNVTVEWKIVGHNVQQNFEYYSGILFFPEGILNTTLYVHLLDDHIPEEKEVYRIILYNIKTEGVSPSGAAVLDSQGYEAVLTVEASDEPHGVLNFASPSRVVLLPEENKTVQLFINREFGSLGAINITYATVQGLVSLSNQTEGTLAEPGADYVAVSDSVILKEGETSAAINVTILEDDVPEVQEFFLVNLTSVELIMNHSTSSLPRLVTELIRYRLKDVEGLASQIIIDANDGVSGVVEWESTNFEVNESHGNLTIMAYRNKGSYGNVSVFFYAQNLEAQLGLDFNVISRTLFFADGERNKSVVVVICDDDIPEGVEKFQLILTNPSFGLELGENSTATITIFANDDGHGVLSFNNSDHFFLREQTALHLMESVAVLNIIREPPQGIFGMVSVQYLVSEINSSEPSVDLTPSQGYIVLEEGVRFKTLHISAILDEEPEMDEHFIVTLFNPTGGARLGTRVQTMITILQNQAPLGLFSIYPVTNRTNIFTVEEANTTVYLKVSRSNGLNVTVSVEWETLSDTAFGIRGSISVLSVLQSFVEESAASWCFFRSAEILYGVLLRSPPAVFSTLYQWKGVFVAIENFSMWDPKSCVSFQIHASPYLVITHGGTRQGASNSSIYAFMPGRKLLKLQTLSVLDTRLVKHFAVNEEDYLVFVSDTTSFSSIQIFQWNKDIFVLHHQLPLYRALNIALFSRGGMMYLLVALSNTSQNVLLYQWLNNEFRNLHQLPAKEIKHMEAWTSGSDIYLIVAKETGNSEIFIWETGQSTFRHFQSLPVSAVRNIHVFMPTSGLVHIILSGKDTTALYSWNSEGNQFSLMLEAPYADHITSATARSLNTSKSLIALSVESSSQIYELTTISNQSDFIPSSGELIFEPGDMEAVIAVNILDDIIPEEEECFKVWLKNPKGGAEIGVHSFVNIIIPSNDNAYGVIAFAQSSLFKQVEEVEQDSLITLNIERLIGTYGRVTVEWIANGSISDIFPASGMITFSEGQALSTITLTILADSVAELSEAVEITLTHVTTVGVQDTTKGAVIDPERARAVLSILPSDSLHGVIEWHMESLFVKVTEPEGQQNSTTVTLQIVREQGFVGDLAVQLSTAPNFELPPSNRATENEDYILEKKTVIMAENATTISVTVTILPDNVPELQEGFIINITDVQLITSSSGGQPSVKRLGLEIAEITIEENDDARGIFNFNVTKDITGAVSGYEVPPPQNVLKLPVVRQGGRFGSAALYWEAIHSTASFEDFTPSFGNLTFADGQATGEIEITIIDDNEVEFLEIFKIALVRVTGGARLGNDTLVTVAIPPNDSPVGVFGFEEKKVTVKEPQTLDDSAAVVLLNVSRSQGGQGAVKVLWILDEAARYDLTPLNGTLHFNEAESQKLIVLHVIQDGLLEGNETFTIRLVSTGDAEISPVNGVATIIIMGDEGASGVVGIAHSSKHVLIGEPSGNYNGTALISLVRGPGIFGEIIIYWNITPPHQTEFTKVSGTLTMRDRQSAAVVLIQAVDDNRPEEKHYYQFQLTRISDGGLINESSSTANITMAASDYPYGEFAFARELLQTTEDEIWVNMTVVRSSGSYGRVRLWFQIINGTAEEGMDFTPTVREMVFEPEEESKIILIEIHDDDFPEGPEYFSLMITEVELQGSGFDFTVRENGLQVDQPPIIGNISTVRVTIGKNDNAEGVIEFDPEYILLEVEEDAGLIMIPVLRKRGTYGNVTADFLSRSISALPDGVDYVIHNNSVIFCHGQNQSFIYISIIDDEESEFAEQFEIQLTGATGGAVLGLHLVSQVTIAKSDSPQGMVRFLNQSQIILPNPDATTTVSLVLERTGRLVEAQINWDILGPNSEEILSPLNSDIGDPVNGSFYFEEGEGGLRTINLQIYPHDEVEVQETFIIRLSLMRGETEIDSKANSITLIIEKFGDPNGIVQFAPESLTEINYAEPSADEGPQSITLFVKRFRGILGNVTVYWEICSESDITGDFLETEGSVVIADQQSTAEIIIYLLPDDVPELDENYEVKLIAVEGGADLDHEKGVSKITVLANDDPYGVFALYSDQQSVLVEKTLDRYVQVNVTRHAGAFGEVMVKYRVISLHEEALIEPENEVGFLTIKDGASFGVKRVPISNQAFISLGLNFTLELTNVSLVRGRAKDVPKILEIAKSALVLIPEEAANSQVGFESVILRLTNIVAGTGHAVISRRGVYGSVIVNWISGYPPDLVIDSVKLGNITPPFGTVVFSSREESKVISFQATPNLNKPETFAITLTAVHSHVSGGARLRSGFTIAEIEPMGIFQFDLNSRSVSVEEDIQAVRLHVQRLFGFQSNLTKLTYQTIPGSAKPLEDFIPIYNGELMFSYFQTSAVIEISIIDDTVSEIQEFFLVNLTSVEVLDVQPMNLDRSPRLNPVFSVATVNILANDILHGILSLGPEFIYVEEDTNNNTSNTAVLQIRRTKGFTGDIKITVRTFGGVSAQSGVDLYPFGNVYGKSNFTWAVEGEDFEEQTVSLTLLDGESESQVSIKIFDDDEPEGQELFYVFLSNPEYGVQIVEGKDEHGFAAFATVIIEGSDLQNGILGFIPEVQSGLVLDEDSEKREVLLTVTRQSNRAFEDVKVFWRVTFNKTAVVLLKDGVNLENELVSVLGATTCIAGQTMCNISIEIKPDHVPEFETYIFVELYAVSTGAALNNSARFAFITVLESDAPHGLVYFAVGSRFAVAYKKTALISLQVLRDSSTSITTMVSYSMQELQKPEPIGRTFISPAVAGQDFARSEGLLTFERGQRNAFLDVTLTPKTGSLNPFPKRFQVVLSNPTGGARVDDVYGISNITIVSDLDSLPVWGLIDQLHQPLDDTILHRILQNLNVRVATETTEEQLTAVVHIIDKVTGVGEKLLLTGKSRSLFYEILCALASPKREDTQGYSLLAEVTEKFAFSLLTGIKCGSPGERGKNILDSCPYIAIMAHNWFPQQINGHRFNGKDGDSIQVPEHLLEVSLVLSSPQEENCESVQFTEYSSQQWFLTRDKELALKNKVFSMSLQGQSSLPLKDNNEVIYRIYAKGNRIVPQKSLCLLWNQAAESWLSDSGFCKVVDDKSDYVECSCSHMSIYAVYAQTDNLSSYNEAFFSSGFLCISGFTLAIISHLFCTRCAMFAAKLLTHMMVACLGTQVSFLASAYMSQHISEESCFALASVTHYLYLCQFSWMLIQAVNFWYVLVMNDEHTETRYLLYFLLSWGLPAFVVILLLIILRGIYHHSTAQIYGLVYGDLCFIPNAYAALFTAALVPLMCLVVVFVVFIHAYQVTPQWKAYDDIFRGRTNAAEIPLVLYLFALISVTWLWGGLHMAYRHLWMLVFFIIFNSLQGLYVFVVYFILHNQLCCPVKASYAVDVNGHTTPGSAFFTHGSGLPAVGGEISKSTQNLISAMEEVPADWERASLQPGSQTSAAFKQSPKNGNVFHPSGGFSTSSLVTDEESQEFDDLIFALKTGAGLSVSDNESCHGSQDGGSMANSQIVELRRIPIADTHL